MDEKLAEYAFFPLTHVFNETQRVSARSLELAARCLRILVEKGWRKNLSPPMGKQLLILMTILAGGSPGQDSSKPQSEELVVAAFDCLSAVFLVLGGPVADKTIYNEIGTTTIVDQTVYLLLEGITDGSSDEICLAAATALRGLYFHVTSRVILASLLPRTVSALTKTLRPTTQARRSYKLLQRCIQLLTEVLKAVLNDVDTFAAFGEGEKEPPSSKDNMVLDESWLKATASQVKLALANVIRLRTHDRLEVREALLELCLMVIEQCSKSLEDSMTMMVETMVVLSELDGQERSNSAYSALRHLGTSNSAVVDIIKSSLHTWIVALPRVMQANDDAAKQRAIRQISTAFLILSQTQPRSAILDNSITASLCDSVAATINLPSNFLQPLNSINTNLDLDVFHSGATDNTFQPILLEHRSQTKTLADLQSMISSLNGTESSLSITRSLLSRLHGASRSSIIAPLWLTLRFLGNNCDRSISLDDMLSDHESSSLRSTRSILIEELYSVSLPILTGDSLTDSPDWRVQALALEAVALQAQQLGESFQPELIDALYLVLQFLGSNNPSLRHHAMTCLNILTTACSYADTSTMLVDNVDYLVNSVGLKLNTFDVSPQAPQVLLMMVKLCGATLIPYLDDLVGSIFAVLDSFHGYPKLVELLFSALGAIIDEGAKKPDSLAITSGDDKQNPARKQPLTPRNVSDIAKNFAERKNMRTRRSSIIGGGTEGSPSHPSRPWTSALDGPEQPKDETARSVSPELKLDSEEPMPPTQEPEDPNTLSKPHSLLLRIAESIPPHLSSPSPFLRRSLLTILTRALPILAHNENSYLPLINNLWHSVSARITFPPSFTSDATSLTTTTTTAPTGGAKPYESNMDETGVKEETFVIVAACEVVKTMCEGARDFMTSRVEHEFPRLKRLYVRVWEKVRIDAGKVSERRHRQQQKRTVPSNSSSLQPIPSKSNDGDTVASALLGSELDHVFTSHHAIWKALTSLLITMLTHVRLPVDMGDDICCCLAVSIVALYPTQLCSHSRNKNKLDSSNTGAVSAMSEGKVEIEISKTIEVMETWNSDLTWFLFQRELAKNVSRNGNNQAEATRHETPRVAVEKNVVDNKGRAMDDQRWTFAEMVF